MKTTTSMMITMAAIMLMVMMKQMVRTNGKILTVDNF